MQLRREIYTEYGSNLSVAIACIELHFLSLFTVPLLIQPHSHIGQDRFYPQLSNVWSVKLRYGPLTTTRWWPHSSSITM